MARCRCCNNPISHYNLVKKNPKTGLDEDLCSTCIFMSKYAAIEREYVGGMNPVEGVTMMKKSE